MPQYHFCDYWKSWSRILSESDDGTITELDLTPTSGGSWEEISHRKTRSHRTARGKRDILTDNLPLEVFDRMVSHLGFQKAINLCTE